MQSELCPVCYTPMKEDIAYIDYGGPVCEHFVNCPNKCYSYEFAYGSTIIYVFIRGHALMFGWYYTDHEKPHGTKAERDAIDIAVKAAQMAQLEDYWVLVKKYGEDQANRPKEPRQSSVDDGLALL
jgi:hypothetical protein